jgi:Enoyl-CoA hydratase/carnithine racemase
VLNRPEKRNAMNEDLLTDLATAIETVDDEDGVRAIALLGEGPVFSAGMDLELMRECGAAARDGRDFENAGGLLQTATDAIASAQVPTVVGIKRSAPAGAFELTLPADFRVLSNEANYGVIEVKLGTFPHGGATQRLPRLVGLARAKEIVLTGEFVDPAEALQMGLVTETCPAPEVDDRARALADSLAENAPLGVQQARTALDTAFDHPLAEGLAREQELADPLYETHDYAEGFAARTDGHDPSFEGR